MNEWNAINYIEKFDDDDEYEITITNKTKSPVTVGSSVESIDATTRTTAVRITANSLDNEI